MTYALERRGYVKAGPWTPECTVEHPEAGQLRKLMFGDRVEREGNVLPMSDKICESASHASQGVSHASHVSRASHTSHASHASHASHSIDAKNFHLLYLHSHKNKNKSIGTR